MRKFDSVRAQPALILCAIGIAILAAAQRSPTQAGDVKSSHDSRL